MPFVTANVADQVQVPGGITTVLPSDAKLTALVTSVSSQLAALIVPPLPRRGDR